jgi:mRNA interferase MazF
MIREGKIVLFRFPQTDQSRGKLRPALVIRKLPGQYDDWLICMISTQVSQQIQDLDDFIRPEDGDFKDSGLKALSLFRVSRLAVVEKSILLGILGEISDDRLIRIKSSLSNWIKGA